MDSLTSMMQKLSPIGIYDLSDGGAVQTELQAYAGELDALYDALDTLTREGFIETAESYGLSARERFGGHEQEELTTAQRRERLLRREWGFAHDGTPSGFADSVRALGVSDFTLEENTDKLRVDLTVADALSDGEKSLFEQRLRAQFPPHAVLVIHYGAE